jgi:hypothetical protein
MGTENEIDQLFKRGLNDPEIPFNELDWEKMERKLDEQKKRRIIPFWIFAGSGIAAALLIFLFWFLSGPSVFEKSLKNPLTDHVTKPDVSNETPLPGTDAVNGVQSAEISGSQSTDSIKINQPAHVNQPAPVQPATESEKLASNAVNPVNVPFANPLNIPSVKPVSPANTADLTLLPNSTAAQNALAAGITERNRIKVISPPPVKVPERLNAPLTDSAVLAQKAMALALSKDPLEKINHTEVARSVQKNMDNVLSQQHNLILSAMAAPDITSGPANKSAKISSNLGMLATYALGSKFSVTSGAIYAKKYYNSGGTTGAVNGSRYTPSTPATDWEVKADCNVLDIPLNVNYKVMNRKKLSVSVNTGLSSYFMLKEKYDYVVDQPGQPQQVTTTEFTNQNQHIFGVANVSVSFDHHISETLSVGVQPFAKLPLTGIGNNDVNLKSTGISFSLNIGLFPAKKPGKVAANRRYSSLW